jgi:nitrogen fixation NifU-like protein
MAENDRVAGRPGVDRRGWDDQVAELQASIDQDLRRRYSPWVLALWKNPENAGSLERPDGYGQVTGPCGDTMQLWLRVADGTITEATFWTDGCGTSIVCASAITVMAKGMTLEAAAGIDQQAVLDELGGLPEEDRHCALLASNTLRAAIKSLRPDPAGPRRGKFRP